MFVVSTRVDGLVRFVGAGRGARHENVADAKRYPTLQAARAAARNVKGSVQTFGQARRSMHASMALASLRSGYLADANLFIDLALAV